MPATASIGSALWLDGCTYNALLLRQGEAARFLNQLSSAQVIGGVFPTGGTLFSTAGTGMSVNVSAGYCVVPSSSGASYGGYLCPSMAATSGLTVATADATNPRIDLVCATVSDVGSSSSFWELQVVTGTPNASPSAPATPSNSIPLSQVTVPANAVSSASFTFSDVRTFITGQGGIVPVRNLAGALAALTGYEGGYIHDRSSHRLAMYNASGTLKQVITLPLTPQIAFNTTAAHSTTTEQTLCTVSVTTDGSTDLEIICRHVGISIAGGAGQGYANFNIKIDGSMVAQCGSPNQAFADSVSRGGFTMTHMTSGAGSDTPSAGSHTITFSFTAHYDGTHQVTVDGTQSPTVLYVRAVPL